MLSVGGCLDAWIYEGGIIEECLQGRISEERILARVGYDPYGGLLVGVSRVFGMRGGHRCGCRIPVSGRMDLL